MIKTENIPKQWLENTITRFHKGKGTKGICSSGREITLNSNLLERILNNRIQIQINMIDERGGGRSKRSTVDLINFLKSIITKNKKDKRTHPNYIPRCYKNLRQSLDRRAQIKSNQIYPNQILFTLCTPRSIKPRSTRQNMASLQKIKPEPIINA